MKKNKAAYTVDITNIDSVDNTKLSFIKARALSGQKITEDEFNEIFLSGVASILNVIDKAVDDICKNSQTVVFTDKNDIGKIIDCVECIVNPKKPWYKRFWAWITRKNK